MPNTAIPETLIALLHGPDSPGIVARTCGWIFENGGNILHADQHRDAATDVFIQRIEWQPAAGHDPLDEAARFRRHATSIGLCVRIARTTDRPKVAVLVSKQGHAYHDLMLRWASGELPCDICFTASNHTTWENAAREHYRVPFHHIPVTPSTKPAAEANLLSLIDQYGIQLLVMARYMQILSEDFLQKCPAPVINIHHSFLPAFVGAKPYHQAYTRGVKLIGATAHYATPILDDGPIIHQAVAPINHRHNVEDLIRLGQDLEKQVLAQSVRWHLQNRILAYGKKTVVFD
ncbi:MAG: formyltetrahydrofolate deformylase [Puniceicoccales bacterium]|jgi:formyltetrahydrofolate deformylase|nr:formyltetrahydrofolate deformylase [Puniceicoccales bacterium]